MGKLSKDEIRSTVHLSRDLTEQFELACKKKYGEDWKKKTGYRDAMQQFVNDTLGEDVVDENTTTEVAVETPTQSTQIVTTENMSVEDKIEIAKKLADERKKQQELVKPTPPFPTRLQVGSDSDINSFLNNVSRDRKIRITRIEID